MQPMFPIYAEEMFPGVPGEMPGRHAFNPFDAAAQIAASHAGYPEVDQTAHMGLEIMGNELDHLLAMSGAGQEIYGAAAYGNGDPYFSGAAAYGALPAQASMPGWMGQSGGHLTGRKVEVKMQPGTHMRRQSLGLATPSTVTANGGTAVATAQPQVPFRPEKLVVPSDFAGSFDITDVKVGKDSQFVAAGSVPARAFDEKAVDNLLSFHASAISQIISVAVVNNGGVAIVFKCYMTGTSVE